MPCSHAKMDLKSAPQKQVCNGKSYIKKLYTILLLQVPMHTLAELHVVTQPLLN